ncbi:MAG: hypothetical protein SAL70_20700 [Scytonema sp. PMC 1070.18]|nr:hypothetical protein [Scytonema sp. PMC 1070.18]
MIVTRIYSIPMQHLTTSIPKYILMKMLCFEQILSNSVRSPITSNRDRRSQDATIDRIFMISFGKIFMYLLTKT